MAKILVVDDSATIVEVIKTTLEGEGHQVITADDGQVGLELAKKEAPDIIILDVMLPRLDGYKICRFLKFDEKYKDIPVIMFTAKASAEDKDIGKSVGADDYLVKDFDPVNLVSIINKYVKKK